MTPPLQIHLLGDFLVLLDGEPVIGFDAPRLQSLLAYLLLHRGAPQPRSHLAYLFWPDSSESQARTNLRKQVHYLRQALPDEDRYLYADAHVLHWKPDAPVALDVADLESALARADAAEERRDPAELRAALEEAVAAYGGELLPSCYEEWVFPEREGLAQRFVLALERLIRLLEGQRDYEAAIQHAQRLLRHDPLHEAAYRWLMRLYALRGDRARALRAYHTCATILQRELGVEPSAATREVYEQLVRLDAAPVPSHAPACALPLVGREKEWADLQAAWLRATRGRPHLLLLTGEVGIGKTRLAEELLEWARPQGISTASARCYASEGDLAYAPVATWLRTEEIRASLGALDPVWLSEVARLLPELLVERPDVVAPGPLAESWQRGRLFDALARAVRDHQPRLLLLDDLQWCDQDTLAWLPYLLRGAASAPDGRNQAGPLLVVATLQPSAAPADGPWSAVLADLRRQNQLVEVELGPLSREETLALAGQVAGRPLDPALAGALHRGSEGNPLFVVEMVCAGLPSGEAWAQEHSREMTRLDLPLPPKVRMVIEARLAQLSPEARDLVGLAAVVGREFTLDVLREASAADEEALVRALDELWQRNIIREQGADAYDFGHGRVRGVAYEKLSAARRNLYHRRVAEALEAVYAQRLDSVSGQIGAHYERSGMPERAIPAYRRAAEAAGRIFASEEALAHVHQALALLDEILSGQPEKDPWRDLAAHLYEESASYLMHLRRLDEAKLAYDRALGWVPAGDSVWQARLRRQIGRALREQGRHPEAFRAFERACTTLDEDLNRSPAWWREWVQVQLDQMWTHYALAQVDEIERLVEATRPHVREHGTPHQYADYLGCITAMELRRERYVVSEEILAHTRTILELVQETGDPRGIADARFKLGFSLLWHGARGEAEEELQAGLRLAQEVGDPGLRAQCLTYLGVLYRLSGEPERVRDYATRCLAVAARGEMEVYAAMAQANLAWLAWREGELEEARQKGHIALSGWTMPYPFQWAALWPLIAVALADGDVGQAVGHAQALLDPVQQRLPGALAAALEAAIDAWGAGGGAAVEERLEAALQHARDLGYL